MTLWDEVRLVAGKDLRIEARSRVTLQQVVPFGLISRPGLPCLRAAVAAYLFHCWVIAVPWFS